MHKGNNIRFGLKGRSIALGMSAAMAVSNLAAVANGVTAFAAEEELLEDEFLEEGLLDEET